MLGTAKHSAANDPAFVRRLSCATGLARREIRQGRFQRSMAVIVSFAAVMSSFEAYVQHRRGAFANKLMWTPVWLTPPLVGSAAAALFDRRLARRLLPITSLASLADGVLGFIYHLRGIGRLPGGYKLGRYNIVMGPPLFAPLLVGMSGVLGLIASFLRPESAAPLEAATRKASRLAGGCLYRQPGAGLTIQGLAGAVRPLIGRLGPRSLQRTESAIAHGRFQKVMAAAAAGFAILAGGEAYFEHLRGSYNATVMWTPVLVTPPMVAAAVASVRSRRAARHVLPWASAVTFLDGTLGFLLHLRGIKRMPGGFGNVAFNITYGPPLFAPLLFCAVGLLGMIASLLRRRPGE